MASVASVASVASSGDGSFADTDHRLASAISLLFVQVSNGRAASPLLTWISPRCSDGGVHQWQQLLCMTAIDKLVLAGEQAGFSVEQMIQLLRTGASVEALLCMIEFRPIVEPRSSRWVM